VSHAPRWSDVYQGLLTLLPSLPAFAGVPVYDGQPITNDAPTAWVSVGYVIDDTAGQFAQVRDTSDFATIETGDIKCHLAAVDGGTDLPATRSKAFGLLAAWQAALDADQTIGGAIPAGSVVNLSTAVLDPQNTQGSATSLLVTVNYQTLTYFT
jgi:hypothetical protein